MSQPGSSTPANSELANSTPGRGLKIAVIILAITTVVFAIWGVVATMKFNNEKNVNSSNVASIEAAQQKISRLAADYGLEKRDFTTEERELTKLRSEYEAAKKAATAASATDAAKLAAAQAQTKLAQGCAAVLANGMAAIYADVPGGVTYAKVADQMLQAAVPCKGVVKITIP